MSKAMQTFIIWGALVGIGIGISLHLNGIKTAINHQTEALMSETCGGE